MHFVFVQKELEKFSDFDIHCAAAALIEENLSRKSVLERYLLQEDDIYCSPKFKRLKVSEKSVSCLIIYCSYSVALHSLLA
jgi:hypothetical protein